MAKQSGLGALLALDGFDLSGDIGAVNSIAGGPALLDVTGIDKFASERIGGQRDGKLSFNAWFNPTITTQEHARLSTLPRTDVNAMLYLPSPTGIAIGDAGIGIIGKQVNYDMQRAADGALMFAVDIEGNAFGLEWGQLLTAGKRSDTVGTNPATGLDDLVAPATTSAFGATVYIQVFSFTGTSVTFTLRDSADNTTFAAVTGGASGAITAIGATRLNTTSTQSIRRYLSVGTSGTFSQVTFAVVVVRHLAASI